MDLLGLAQGAKGLTFTALSIGLADEAVIQKRAGKCDACPSKKKGYFGDYCDDCGCWLTPKQQQQSAKCPKGEW